MIVKSGPVTGPSTVIVIGMPSPTQPKPTWTVVDALTVMWYFPSPVRLVAITVIVVVLVPPATSIGYVGVKSIVGFGGRTDSGAASSINPPANPLRLWKVMVEIAAAPWWTMMLAGVGGEVDIWANVCLGVGAVAEHTPWDVGGGFF